MNMRLGKHSILGIAIDDRSITVSEVSPGESGDHRVVRGATMMLDAPLKESDAATVGEQFASFLNKHNIKARATVVGLPASWLMVKEKNLPPVEDEAAIDMLRLMAEREFAMDSRDLAVDAMIGAISDAGRPAMLIATLQRKIAAIKVITDKARLKVIGVTGTGVALSSVEQSRGTTQSMTLRTTAAGAELSAAHHGLVAVRHLGHGHGGHTDESHGGDAAEADSAALIKELRRATMTLTTNGDNAQPGIAFWDGVGLPSGTISRIENEMSLPLHKRSDMRSIGVSEHPFNGSAAYGNHGAAAALALSRETLPVNFLKPCLAPPAAKRWSKARIISWSTAIVLLLVGSFVFDIYSLSSSINEHQAYLKENEATIEDARALRDDIRFARTWYSERTVPIKLWYEVTDTFPQVGTVWATSFTLNEKGEVAVMGKSRDEQSVQTVIDKMRQTPSFTDVTQRNLTRRTDEWAFTITFVYKPTASSKRIEQPVKVEDAK